MASDVGSPRGLDIELSANRSLHLTQPQKWFSCTIVSSVGGVIAQKGMKESTVIAVLNALPVAIPPRELTDYD